MKYSIAMLILRMVKNHQQTYIFNHDLLDKTKYL